MSTKKKFKGRVVCTRTQFDALTEKDPQKEYLILEEEEYASLTEQNDFSGINNFNAETNFNEEVNVHNHNLTINHGYIATTDEDKDLVTKYSADEIVIENGTGADKNLYSLKLPTKNGTLATTDDVPEVDIDSQSITKNTDNKLQATGIIFNNELITAEMLYNATHMIINEESTPTADPIFANNSWETISQISQEITQMSETGDDLYTAIESKYGWKVGDTKEFTIESGKNAGTYTAQIWDFNVDTDKDGNKLGIRLGTVELMKTVSRMNDALTNVGGFGASKMAGETLPVVYETLPVVYETLPSDLKDMIKETKVTYHSGSDDPNTEISGNFKLFLMSEFEIFNSTRLALQEGVYLKYWKDHNTNADRIKKQLGSADATWYWLRSATRGNSSGFADVNSDGSLLYGHGAIATGGVCLTFNI